MKYEEKDRQTNRQTDRHIDRQSDREFKEGEHDWTQKEKEERKRIQRQERLSSFFND